ncbi:VOC family protein [Rhodovulum sp. 12E13]|uniref:VOC family protein n=1 Tax=Rhodovulum sp. 12E13 TaxID=2203891 RepID=UPI000E120777|nr:VOC family protein [Rhodovulum sp. 12E13]RDC74757.1 VOC family protein [Rhodovulum sp. 12E13]
MSAAARPEGATLAITFLYYRDLAAAARFYEDVLGLPLAIDQVWSRIYRLAGGAHVGLVDEARGAHRASDSKPVQLCLRVPDVDAWHVWAAARRVGALTPVRDNDALGIRVFTFEDPEGHQIEIQTPTREGA